MHFSRVSKRYNVALLNPESDYCNESRFVGEIEIEIVGELGPLVIPSNQTMTLGQPSPPAAVYVKWAQQSPRVASPLDAGKSRLATSPTKNLEQNITGKRHVVAFP